jgi:aryl-alcohol dehydrogenase-like predicted oxidoreductase
MNYRSLGNSGLKVSELSLGSWTTFGGSVGEADSAPIVRRAFELGINLFDTADVYVKGGAERALGAAIRDLPRGELVIATKCMGRVGEGPLGRGLSRKHIFDAMDASLGRLGVDYVDLYQFHAPDAETPIEESLHALEDLVRLGKTRYIGFSNFDEQPPLADEVVAIQARERWTRMISSQPRYSLLDRHVEDGHAAYCRKHGIGMIVYSPLAQGVLTNKYAAGPPRGQPRQRHVRPLPRVAEGAHAREHRRGRTARHVVRRARPRAGGGGAGVGAAQSGGLERDPRRHERGAARAEPEGARGEVERRGVARGGDAGVERAAEARGQAGCRRER